MPAAKHRRQLIAWQVLPSSRDEISQPGIALPIFSLRFGYLSTIFQYFKVVSDHTSHVVIG